MEQKIAHTFEVDDEKTKCNSQQNLNILDKTQDLSDFYGESIDANAEVEKKGHSLKISSCEADTLSEMESKSVNCDQASSHDYTRGNESCLKAQSMVISSSPGQLLEISKEESCIETIPSTPPVSNEAAFSPGQTDIAVDGALMEGSVSKHFHHKLEPRQCECTNIAVTLETEQPLNKECNGLGRIQGYLPDVVEDCPKLVKRALYTEKQFQNESCSSNSLHAVLPSSSSDSCQEASAGGKLAKLSNGSMSSYVCSGLQGYLKEPTLKSILLDTAQQTTTKAVCDTSISPPGKQVTGSKTSEPTDGEMVLQLSAEQHCGDVNNMVLPESSILKEKIADDTNQDKVGFSSEHVNAVEVACSIVREIGEQGGHYMEASRSPSPVQERGCKTLVLSYADSKKQDKKQGLTETEFQDKQCNEHFKLDSLCCKHISVDAQMLMENDHGEVVDPSKEMNPSLKDVSLQGEGSSSRPTNLKDASANGRTGNLYVFDLNEDAPEKGEYHEESVVETLSCSLVMPIAVVAKSGVPISLPVTPVRFGGELGWKGSAATSAFRPTLSWSSNKSKEFSTSIGCYRKLSQNCEGIDLNVAAAGDDNSVEFSKKTSLVPSSFPSQESCVYESSKSVERFTLDLNRLSETDENCQQSGFPTLSLKRSAGDFDLNNSPSIGNGYLDDCEPFGLNWQLKNRRLDDAPVTSLLSTKQTDLSSVSPPYRADSSAMQTFVDSPAPFPVPTSHMLYSIEQLQGYIPIQPKPTYTASQLRPPYMSSLHHSFPYGNQMSVDPSESPSLYTPGVQPHITDPNRSSFLPQMQGSGALPTFYRTPYDIPIIGGPSSSVSALRPSCDQNGGSIMSESRIREENSRQLLVPASKMSVETQMKFFQQLPLSTTPMKRREPEGGWDFYQFGHRQIQDQEPPHSMFWEVRMDDSFDLVCYNHGSLCS